MVKADKIITGKIYTMEKEKPLVECMAIKDDEIIYTGTAEGAEKFKTDKTVMKKYDTGVLVPGFTEGHAHVSSTVELIAGPLVNQDSIEGCQQAILTFAKEHPKTDVIYGGGFDPGLFQAKGPTADVIDAVVSDRPVIISDEGHHSVWVNSKAMEIANITEKTKDPANGTVRRYPGTNQPTGFLQELAIALIEPAMPRLREKEYKEAIEKYQEIALSTGIVSAFEPMLSPTGDEEYRFNAYEKLAEEHKLKITFRVAPTLNPGTDEETFFTALQKLHKRFMKYEKVQVNTVKFFMDGVVDGHTALLREPYKMPPRDCGPQMFEQKTLNQLFIRTMKEGYTIHVHAIGDAAIDEALNAFEAGKDEDRIHRNAITHLQVSTADHPKRMKDMDIIAVVNPYWCYETPLYEPLEKPFLGKERAEKMYPIKRFLEEGVTVSQASDFPVTIPPDTMFCLHMMVNRKDPKTSKKPYWPQECITPEEALYILTMGGAIENRLEDKIGSLKEGKKADFVCLDQDVLAMEKQNLYRTKVMETWIDGECVYKKCALDGQKIMENKSK